jgi:signal transduction histidine kinase/DNA-binding response OmpR family regulator
MHLSIGTKIGIGFALALVAVLAIGIVTTINLDELTDDNNWVTHTVEVQQQLEAFQGAFPEAESNVRGYELNGSPEMQDGFHRASAQGQNAFQKLRDLTSDNPIQQQRLDRLGPLMNERFTTLQQILALPPTVTLDDQRRQELFQQGTQTMTQIQQIVSDMKDEERGLLDARRRKASFMTNLTHWTVAGGSAGALLLVAIAGALITRSITSPLRRLGEGASTIGGGDYAHRVPVTSRDEVGQMGLLFNRMAEQVQQRQTALAEQDELKQNLASFSTLFQGQRDLTVLCPSVLSKLATLLEARHSVFYLTGEESKGPYLKLQASYAFDQARPILQQGESLAGQAMVDRQRVVLTDIPENYLRINSAMGETRPRCVVVQPVVFEGRTRAVLELATTKDLRPIQLTFLDQLAQALGVVLNTVAAVMRTEELLEQTRHSEKLLQEQQEELQQANEEMQQTNEEMQQTNEEMEEKVRLLAEQKLQLENANQEIEESREELEKRAQEIARSSRYKSEFLANMSHELRTPLNSLLILSKMLADNAEGNLNEKQMKYAQTINSSGSDLLELINEVLDLARIESGAVVVEPEEMALTDLRGFLDRTFRHVAQGKGLELRLEFAAGLPATILTDTRRLQQILKNLLSNAFKFTERGSVTIRAIQTNPSQIAFAVVDTGIGIPADKQDIIFGAFQQVDTGTSRKYGGTGLGLSISRELAGLLGGSLELTHSGEQGSTFTLFLPDRLLPSEIASNLAEVTAICPVPASDSSPRNTRTKLEAAPEGISDDRDSLQEGDLVLLIIEDDRAFSELVRDFAREKGFKAVVAHSAAQGMALAREILPAAVTLDLHLPDNDGWVVLDRLKHDPKTRHVPIHVISVDEERARSLRLGAVSYIQKPVTREKLDEALTDSMAFVRRPLKNLLIIEDDAVQRDSLADLIGNGDVHTTAVGTAEEALRELATQHYDCIVLDLGLPDAGGADLIREIHRKLGVAAPPIIVYTGKELSRAEESELRMISDSIVIKNVRSPERLLDETALFLHRVQSNLPEPKQRMIEQVQRNDSLLVGRKVLIVDDDVRNIFAITSALEASQMQVSYAESGQAGIDLLKGSPDIEIVLMDVMMPEMDGYEAIRRIRGIDRFRSLPIISVTAKAMKDDREKCLRAGASDYITKPVDLDQLRSLLRVWLYKR